jgi:hypothetical protein
MTKELRDAWRTTVRAADYERHMAGIGQAESNAGHVREFFARHPIPTGERALLGGAGTGQMFDYVAPAFLAGCRPVFTDINPQFLALLRERLRKNGAPPFHVLTDDLEQSCLSAGFYAVLLVLVLEHIDWRKGLDTVVRFAPRWILAVIQRNPPAVASAVTPGRVLPGSMNVFTGQARPALVDRDEMVAWLGRAGYRLEEEIPRGVADGKVMLGCILQKG